MPGPKDADDHGGLHKALSHPLRAQILLTIQKDGSSSPTRFTDEKKGTDNEVSLNVVAYHFRVLLDHGAIELVETIPRRGATEHVYGLTPNSPAVELVRATELLLQISADEGGAFLEPDSADGNGSGVAILPLDVDAQGREELNLMMASMRSGLKEIAQNCRRRLAESSEEPISIRVGFATYAPGPEGTAPASD